jgi:hypothetical protein
MVIVAFRARWLGFAPAGVSCLGGGGGGARRSGRGGSGRSISADSAPGVPACLADIGGSRQRHAVSLCQSRHRPR